MKWLRDQALAPIVEKVEAGERLSFDEGMRLYHTRDLNALMRLANQTKMRLHGDKVYFVHSMRLEFTNICYVGCTFCAFAARKGEDRAWDYSPEEVVEQVRRRYLPGITELHMSSGHHPNHPWAYYPEMVRRLRAAFPDLQVKAFTAAEIEHLSRISKMPTLDVLRELQAAGLAAMPGGGAEIFADRVRRQVAKNKVKAEKWLQIHREAHSLGMRTNATMLYGHIETLEERLDHLHRLRELQDETGGFHAFIPLAFQPLGNTLAQNLGKTEFTTGLDDLRNLAVARVYLDNFPHIKGYWVMIGSELTQVSLDWGVSDIDGTIQEEHIAHAAGATSPMALSQAGMVRMIQQAGRVPVLRDAYYHELEVFPRLGAEAAD
ncbi:Thiamine biosynthesis enzyme ThiH, Radical SAM superfamily enzyme [Deinococcus geothermalis DSM 11300]|uniref:Aminodeoxyfutalosine synthase n=1 Tax=Deinococcus geothermalis (strain DSM 11300 / CIP 105573 / AG-3a) TaxID=319795 RepID=Q1IWJ3_DEIGD|nr:aminofutalosine synthase MqnE [Deinococcus geothermalis]ABF46391.1 Thiamine biosynthesis enzyme ThiH, Radical SAM superfamily enzyme [Deinococcus geothermalis DSM 11300]